MADRVGQYREALPRECVAGRFADEAGRRLAVLVQPAGRRPICWRDVRRLCAHRRSGKPYSHDGKRCNRQRKSDYDAPSHAMNLRGISSVLQLVHNLHKRAQHRTVRGTRAGRWSFRQAAMRVATVAAMKLGAGLFGILMFTATLPVGAGERMTLKVSPAIAFAPANLIVRAMIEADAGNRAITIVAESDDFYRSSQIQLDGDHAPRTARSNSAASRPEPTR